MCMAATTVVFLTMTVTLFSYMPLLQIDSDLLSHVVDTAENITVTILTNWSDTTRVPGTHSMRPLSYSIIHAQVVTDLSIITDPALEHNTDLTEVPTFDPINTWLSPLDAHSILGPMRQQLATYKDVEEDERHISRALSQGDLILMEKQNVLYDAKCQVHEVLPLESLKAEAKLFSFLSGIKQ